ncbi:GNAT family N-acetyltransferase [Mesorhizobium sp.]|uniref:GNAT family N-acetyltransferase n=1 Tax=Mesorhizobium sp. TaxID=1871066 RepID=UPI000FE9F5A5|nr:GNAT family N-acetyltransferase [Mesorhizobium sp.]RWB53556.1 MAG: GNAT family N-acetyltransferase [Mesorhizobium sp.]
MSVVSSIEFRPAGPADAAAIKTIVRAAYAKWVPVIGREPLPMRADYDKALDEHQFELAIEHGRIVGLIETMAHDDHIWIENVAVAPEARGRGIGRKLLDRAEHRAVEAGCRELRLLTNGAFAANVLLYRRHGYAIDREEPFMNGTTVYMSKRLATYGAPPETDPGDVFKGVVFLKPLHGFGRYASGIQRWLNHLRLRWTGRLPHRYL